MKKYNDKVKRIIMNNGNSMEVKYKSELLEQIRHDFEIMENESSDIDPGFFTEDDVWSLYEFLLMRHKDDWFVIDDMKDSGTRIQAQRIPIMKKRRSIFMKKNIQSVMKTITKIKIICEYEGAV